MLKTEYTAIYGWEAAIRGMRNPMNSWNKSDSKFGAFGELYKIGDNDLKLAKSLSKAGNDHAKFIRTIIVTVDITAPLYWWKECDTYKVGTVSNSCSTMHKIHERDLTLDDFSHEHLNIGMEYWLSRTIEHINAARKSYLADGNKESWWQMIQMLPSSYNQRRTIELNYQVLKNMYFARKNHKLDEWKTLCDWMLGLPYFKDICVDIYGEVEDNV